MSEFKDYLEADSIETAEKHFGFEKSVGYYDYYECYDVNYKNKPSIHVFISNGFDNRISIFKSEDGYYVHIYEEYDCGGLCSERQYDFDTYEEVIEFLYRLESGTA